MKKFSPEEHSDHPGISIVLKPEYHLATCANELHLLISAFRLMTLGPLETFGSNLAA